MNLIVMGPVGSGKSTQAELISKHLGISLLNVGDLLYLKGLEKSSEAKKITKVMESGGLVNDQQVSALVQDHLRGSEHKGGVVIDGFPRSLWQAENFDFPVDKVIYLVVSDRVNKRRLAQRGRTEDTPSIIEKRLMLYHRETAPILDFYKVKGILVRVDGERPIDAIFEDIKKRLKTKSE